MSTAWPAEERLQRIDWESLPAVSGDVTESPGRSPGRTGGRASPDAPAATAPYLDRRRARMSLPRRCWGWRCGGGGFGTIPVDGTPDALLDALLRDLAGAGAQAQPPPPDWPTRLSYPEWLAEEFRQALGEDAEAFAAASNLPGPVTVRANTLRLKPKRAGRASSKRRRRIATGRPRTPWPSSGGTTQCPWPPQSPVRPLRGPGRGFATGGPLPGRAPG